MRIRGLTLKEWCSFPRSFLINWKLFGFKNAIICPILISKKVECVGLSKGKIVLNSDSKYRGMVRVGFDGFLGVADNKKGYFIIGEKGSIAFCGSAVFGKGSSIRVDAGVLRVGTNICCNKNCFISCTSGISFGNDVLIGWNTSIRDSDGHVIMHDSIEKEPLSPVQIGNHVWIASEVDILKGVEIPDDCVVEYRSYVTKGFSKPHCLIGGYPARVIQTGISWKN